VPPALRFRSGELWDGSQRSHWPQLAVIGAPIEHSLSPTLHGAALEALGLAARYERLHVEPEALAVFLQAALESGMRGLNLTHPHKQLVLACGVRPAEEVVRVGAANTLVARGTEWVAHNTDLRGFALALQRWRGRSLAATLREVLVLGSGGAARAVCAALEDLGALRVRLAARHPAHAAWALARGLPVTALAEAEIGTASLVVQCTPLGWKPDDPSPLSDRRWRSAAAFDLCYASQPTAFLAQARAAGAAVEDGRAMLVAQAALAFTLWFGGASPLAIMARSLELDWESASGTDASGGAD
jgi:shikimate dehydrogenase